MQRRFHLGLSHIETAFSICISVFFTAALAHGAVTFDNATAASCGGTTGNTACTATNTTLTYSHAMTTAADRVLLVFVHVAANPGTATYNVSSVTYAGAALTLVRRFVNPTAVGTRGELWVKTAPATGSNNVVVVMGGAMTSSRSIHVNSLSAYGVDQTFPLRSSTYNIGNGTSPSVTLEDSVSSDLIVNSVCSAQGTGTSALTTRASIAINTTNSCDNSIVATASAGARTLTRTVTSGRWNSIAAVVRSADEACTSPSAGPGTIRYIAPDLYFCDGNTWMSMRVADTGVACTTAGAIERSGAILRYCSSAPTNWIQAVGSQTNGTCSSNGALRYNSSASSAEYCDGTNWLTAQSGTTGIAFVKLKENSNASTTTTISTGNFTGSLTAGNLVACAVWSFTTTVPVSTVTDSKGNIYSRASGPYSSAEGSGLVEWWYSSITTGGTSFNVTATWPTSLGAYTQIICLEYSGMPTMGLLDATDMTSGSGAASSSNAIVASASQSLIIAFVETWGSPTPGSGYTARSYLAGTLLQDSIVNTNGSKSSTATVENAWQMNTLIFRGR